VTTVLPIRPVDATLSVTKAARLLGVHPNTIRSWSDQGRLRYYRINPRGDRRYRLGDLQRFLEVAASGTMSEPPALVAVHPGSTPLAQVSPQRDKVADFHAAARRRAAAARATGRGAAVDAATGLLDDERHHLDLRILSQLADATAQNRDLDAALDLAVGLLREAYGHALVAVLEVRDEFVVPRAVSSVSPNIRLSDLPATFGVIGIALNEAAAVRSDAPPGGSRPAPVLAGAGPEIAVPIAGRGALWGVLLAVAERPGSLAGHDLELLGVAARQISGLVERSRLLDDASQQVHRLDALRRVAEDIGSKLDLDEILSGLVDHAMVLFGGDRAGVFLRNDHGQMVAGVVRGLSSEFLAAVRDFPSPSLPAMAVAIRRPIYATSYRDDPRGSGIRAAVVQEGFDTICTAPLFDGSHLLGLLNIYHDRPHHWTDDEIDTLGALATQAGVAIKTAQNYTQMATWAAQLQSIQKLGARLSRLTSVRDIGLAIATELQQLIDYHNVRVYRLYEDDLVPVAMQGQVGEYIDETPEQLHVKIGQGITGWVAANKIAQNLPDAAKDPRASTIPGTEEDLDESMLLAPMVFEDQVLGVLVLSKLGLNQFRDDDLRLLTIYGSFAAQAMANADATERLSQKSAALERQLRGQSELLEITESILATLEPRAVLGQITERLGELVRYDNIAIEVVDRAGRLQPLTARGIHAAEYLQPWDPGETGLATWVVEHNEPQLVVDQLADPRVNQFRGTEGVDGSLICVPLRGREGATGVLTLERFGADNRFDEGEFELVKLFAAQVSIALQNAEAHNAVEIRARTDDLTGLLNHGTFEDWLERSVAARETFSIIMLDLDDFKAVNDALGHQAGDRLLSEIASAIVAAARDSDQVFRYGGDEIALILAGTDAEGALQVAERVRAAVHEVGGPGTPWAHEDLSVTASFGLATYPTDGHVAEQVLLAADRACFVAKRTGRDRIATAAEGLALAAEFSLQEPTPVDPPSVPLA
jgi:diguanylate cyclase (GGDEF)-like protein/excisionase family DNA binding protein